MEKQVNKTFKLLSFLGIYFVVSAHLPFGGVPLLYNWFTPYSFHVPMFLFISGYFYKEQSADEPLKYILKKAKKLLVPLYFWNLFYGILATVITRITGIPFKDMTEPFNLKTLLLMPLINGHQFSLNQATWFVAALFTVEVGNVLIRFMLRKIKAENEWVLTAAYLLLGVLGINISYTHTDGFWLMLTRFLFLLPCYGIGTLYNRKLEKMDTLPHFLYFGIVFLVQLIVKIVCRGHSLIYLSSWMSGFECGPIIPYITFITGTAFWLRVAKLLTPALGDNKAVRYIADHTFDIMTHHLLGFFLLNVILHPLSSFIDPLTEFNYIACYADVMYVWRAFGSVEVTYIYLLVGFGVALIFAAVTDKVKRLFLAYKPMPLGGEKAEN